MGVGVLDGTKANSAPNLVGVGAGAELGNIHIFFAEKCCEMSASRISN